VAKIDPNLYDKYAGRYQIKPELILTIERSGDRLLAQTAGQPPHPFAAQRFSANPEVTNDWHCPITESHQLVNSGTDRSKDSFHDATQLRALR
jgi:hypothetical protein